MSRSTLEVYAYVVCLIVLIYGIGAAGQAVYDVVRVVAPGFTLDPSELRSQWSRAAYHHARNSSVARPWAVAEGAPEAKEDTRRLLVDLERWKGLQDLISQAIYLTIYGVVFAMHWRLGRRGTPRAPDQATSTPEGQTVTGSTEGS